MKSKHIKPKSKGEELKFPLLAEYLQAEKSFIVLFNSKHEGVIVVNNNRERRVGEHSNWWVDVDDKSCWRILAKDEKIVLSNS